MLQQPTSLQLKIRKQLQYIKEELLKFKRSFPVNTIKEYNFVPYIEALNKVFELNNSYGEDYYEWIEKKNLEFVLGNNKEIMNDACQKLRFLSNLLKQSHQTNFQSKTKISSNNGICKLCSQHIESQNIQQAKNDVQDSGINSLKRMLKKIQQESNAALFTQDQDKYFFKQLNRVLTKKEQILSITDNHLEKYLQEIMKNMQQIKYLEELKDTNLQPMPQSINWETKFKSQINHLFLKQFKGKVPPWIQKTFEYFLKIHEKISRQFKVSNEQQTDPYTQEQVFELRKQIEKHKQQEKNNRVINGDYVKVISEKEERIKVLEIQNSVLKDKVLNKDINDNKLMASNSYAQFRSLRNSSLNHAEQKLRQSQTQSKKPSKFKTTQQTQKTPASGQKMQKATQNSPRQQPSQFGQQTRKDLSVTEHISANSAFDLINTNSLKVKRKNNKKLTDIEYFKKMKENSNRKQSFLPLISKPMKDMVLEKMEMLNTGSGNKQDVIKKISILSDYSLKITKPEDKSHIAEKFTLQLPSLNRQAQQHQASQSIIQVSQPGQQTQSLLQQQQYQQLTQSQRFQRIKKYKQTVSDVQNQLQNKLHSIEMLKNKLQMKKGGKGLNKKGHNSSFAFSNSGKGNTRKDQYSYKQINCERGYAAKDVLMIQEGVQTQNVNVKDEIKQNGHKKTKSTLFKQHKPSNSNTQPINTGNTAKQSNSQQNSTQTEKTQIQLIKCLQENQNLSHIASQHLEKILTKLLSTKTGASGSPQKSIEKQSKIKDKSLSKRQKENKSKSKGKDLSDKENKLDDSGMNLNISRRQNNCYSLYQNHSKSPQSLSSKRHLTTNLNQSSILNESICQQTSVNSNYSSLFTKKDFSLFLTQQNSFLYETNLKKKYHKTPFSPLTPQQEKNLTSIYSLIQLIKQHSLHYYTHILSFIKYPYQTVVNNFAIVNIVKQMSLQAFLNHFMRIKHYHLKCIDKDDGKQDICGHVQNFIVQVAKEGINSVTAQPDKNQQPLLNKQKSRVKIKDPSPTKTILH